MEKGKIAAQCCHAAVECAELCKTQRPKEYHTWRRSGMAKVVVKCNSEAELLSLERKGREAGLITSLIQDAGRTQIAPGSITVCGFGPDTVAKVDEVTGHLKLY